MISSPCARLITRIIPKITLRPRATITRTAMLAVMPSATTRISSGLMETGGRRLPRPPPVYLLRLRCVLDVLIRVGQQVAYIHGVRRRHVRERLQDLEPALVVDLGEVDGVNDVMALRVEFDPAFWSIEGETALQRLNDPVQVEGPGLVHGHGPQMPPCPDDIGRVGDVRVFAAESSPPALHELAIGGIVQLLEVRIDHGDALRFLGRQDDLLVPETDRWGNDRDFVLHARRSVLTVERDVIAANQ